MDYSEARDYLIKTLQFGSRLGLERMNRLMELLGNPGEKIRYFHLAGTNGKGSVTMMTANSLAAGGHRVGIYTSPYIERFAERIRVLDGREGLLRFSENEAYGEIPDTDFADGITRIKSCVDRMLASGMEHPTEFELITALAFLHFEKTGCGMVVLETGLGGRLDSTNWVRTPRKCILTALGYDHMDRLGNTIGEIASEKAGIIKADAEVVLYDPGVYASKEDAETILSVVRAQCEIKKAKNLTIVSDAGIHLKSYSVEGQSFLYDIYSQCAEDPAGISDSPLIPNSQEDCDTKGYASIEFSTSLLGVYQPMNCAVAIESCRNIVGMESIRTGIRLTRWPARMERIRKANPPVFLDGGHNAQGATALRDTLEQLLPGEKIVFLCGVMRDKEYEKMLGILFSSSQYQVESVFCTKPDNPRALPASDLAKSVAEILDNLPQSSYNKFTTVIFDDNVSAMTDKAFKRAAKANAVFVAFGSLYMTGEIREKIRHDYL